MFQPIANKGGGQISVRVVWLLLIHAIDPFRTAVPFWRQTTREFHRFVPNNGTAGLKGLSDSVKFRFEWFCLPSGYTRFSPQHESNSRFQSQHMFYISRPWVNHVVFRVHRDFWLLEKSSIRPGRRTQLSKRGLITLVLLVLHCCPRT